MSAAAACLSRPSPRAAPVVHDLSSILADLKRAHSGVASYTAEAKLTSFGPEGRRRATALIAVMRPASLSYQLLGPHGGLIEAFATDGTELQLYDVSTRRFAYGRATATNLAALLGGLAVRQSASAWVALFFGEVAIPHDADVQLHTGQSAVALSWKEGAKRHVVTIDSATHEPQTIEVEQEGTLVSRLRILERDARRLPTQLVIEMPSAKREVRIELRDVAANAPLQPGAFRLDPPTGTQLEHLPP